MAEEETDRWEGAREAEECRELATETRLELRESIELPISTAIELKSARSARSLRSLISTASSAGSGSVSMSAWRVRGRASDWTLARPPPPPTGGGESVRLSLSNEAPWCTSFCM